jgi:hypothetical protein
MMSPMMEFLLKWLYLSSLLGYNRDELLSIPQQPQQQQPIMPKLYFTSPVLCDWQRSALFSFAYYPSAKERFQAVDEARSWTCREVIYKLHPPVQKPHPTIEEEDIQRQQILGKEFYELLPQLVGVALHSPHCTASTHHSTDPVWELRKLLLRQCRDDPNMGIALCWLLEAEIGRTWKTLFEHMEQTVRSKERESYNPYFWL